MVKLENQSNPREDRRSDNAIIVDESVSLSTQPKSSPKWQNHLFFWRHQTALPIIKKNILPARRISKLPAILLGVLLFFSLLKTDLSYWNSVVNTGTIILAIPVRTINIVYTQFTKPLNYMTIKTDNFIKDNNSQKLLIVISNWEKSAERGYKKVVRKIFDNKTKIVRKLKKVNFESNFALARKNNDWATRIKIVKEKRIDQSIRLIKEETVVRRDLLEARASAFVNQTNNFSSQFLFSIERGANKVQNEIRVKSLQAAIIWNSALLSGIEDFLNTYRQTYENLSVKIIKGLALLDDKLFWLENLPILFNQKVSATWNSVLVKANEVVASWSNFMNPNEISPEALEEIKKAVAEEITKNLQGQIQQNVSGVKQASYGAVVVPSTGNTLADEKLKEDLENQFSDEVSISFDKSGQAGVITPIFENGQKGDDYIFMLTPIKK
ncbi:MAG: hypothetical protein WCX70_00280 [Candidatus Paceibacterota bacterium]|jgi:hypothetical protein